MKRGAATGLWLGGIGLGAGLMYLLDPDKGHARRIRLRDKAVHGGHVAERAVTQVLANARNRTQGAVVETIDRLADLPVPDSILVERVRAKMGHFIDNAHAIQVTVTEGNVRLEGRVRAEELDDLLEGVASVRGVARVENGLEIVGIDESGACCGAESIVQKLKVPVAIGVLGAVGAVLAFRMRERQQTTGTSAPRSLPIEESMPESIAQADAWTREPLSLMREAA